MDGINLGWVLDARFSPVSGPVTRFADARAILLTGATGLLGGHVLAELLASTRAEILCLVRAPSSEAALERLTARLGGQPAEELGLIARIRPIRGDLSQPLFGLSARRFAAIGDTVDAIVHCGAAVDFLGSLETLWPANVLGAKEVIRLACQGRAKAVHHVSSTSVFAGTAARSEPGPRLIREDEMPLEPGAENPYARTKWAADTLMRRAGESGVAVAIYRPSSIVDESPAGVGARFAWALMGRVWLAIGGVPENLCGLNLVFADQVARAIVHLARQDDSIGKSFHLINPVKTPFDTIVDLLRRKGHTLSLVPNNHFPQWVSDKAARSSNPEFVMLCALANKLEQLLRVRPAIVTFDNWNAARGLAGSGIAARLIDDIALERFYTRLSHAGLLAVPTA